MSIRHTYGDEDNRPDAVPAGVYTATIKSACEKISKASGNEMLEIIWAVDGGPDVFDYVTFGPKTAYKVDTLLKATGNAPAKGEEVELKAEDMTGWRAFLDLRIEDDPQFGRKNKVSKYVTDKGVPPALPF
jgi:hypothetical protein